MRRPCNDCPWRRDAPPGYWDPQHFIDIATNCRDDGTHIMGCHKATRLPEGEQHTLVCQGWVRVMGYDAIGVRLAVMRGTVSPEEVEDRSGPPLVESFQEMLAANRIATPPRNRWTATDDDEQEETG